MTFKKYIPTLKFKLTLLKLTKRQTFVSATLVLTLGLIATQLLPLGFRYQFVLLLDLMAFLLAAFCLREDLKKHEWLTLLVLPTFFTMGISYFYFLLPVRWITRLPVAFLYALGFYALLLTENIFNVSSQRTIQLIRAAQTVGYYLTLVTCFLFIDLLFSLHLPFFINAIVIFVISLLLFVQYFWSIALTDRIEKTIWVYSFVFALCLAEITMGLSFWPVRTLTGSLFLTSVFYTFLGIGGYQLQQKLLKRVAIEFSIVSIFAFILMFITTSWTS